MKITLINASPKFKDSASGVLLNIAKEYLTNETVQELECHKTEFTIEEIEKIVQSDALIFSFPLYIDSIPSHLLRCLWQLEAYVKEHPVEHKIQVGAIVNNGFFDGKQDAPAIESISHWCRHCGFDFIQGVGVGGGGMLAFVSNIQGENGPKKNVALALKEMCGHLKEKKAGAILAVEPNYPMFMYKFQAELGWRMLAKKNGLHAHDLKRRL